MEAFLDFAILTAIFMQASLRVWCSPRSLVSSVDGVLFLCLMPFSEGSERGISRIFIQLIMCITSLLYTKCCTIHAASCMEKKILKIRKIFCIFDSFFKKAWHIYFKCTNEDLTLHQMGCSVFLTDICVLV